MAAIFSRSQCVKAGTKWLAVYNMFKHVQMNFLLSKFSLKFVTKDPIVNENNSTLVQVMPSGPFY